MMISGVFCDFIVNHYHPPPPAGRHKYLDRLQRLPRPDEAPRGEAEIEGPVLCFMIMIMVMVILFCVCEGLIGGSGPAGVSVGGWWWTWETKNKNTTDHIPLLWKKKTKSARTHRERRKPLLLQKPPTGAAPPGPQSLLPRPPPRGARGSSHRSPRPGKGGKGKWCMAGRHRVVVVVREGKGKMVHGRRRVVVREGKGRESGA